MPYPFYKLKDKLTLIESNTLKEELTKLNNQYEEVFGKSNIDLNPLIDELTIKSTGGSKKRSRRRNKRSMKGGSYDAIIGGSILLVFLYFCLFSEAEEDQYRGRVSEEDRYRGRVPDEYRDMEPYPAWYQRHRPLHVNTNSHAAWPGRSNPHAGIYDYRYGARNYMAREYDNHNMDYDQVNREIAEEHAHDFGLMQRGVQRFEDVIRQRNYDLRPGGPTETAAGRFLRPIIMRGAQQNYDEMTGNYSPDENEDRGTCMPGDACSIMGGGSKKK